VLLRKRKVVKLRNKTRLFFLIIIYIKMPILSNEPFERYLKEHAAKMVILRAKQKKEADEKRAADAKARAEAEAKAEAEADKRADARLAARLAAKDKTTAPVEKRKGGRVSKPKAKKPKAKKPKAKKPKAKKVKK
jgi:colicin import membrane protein